MPKEAVVEPAGNISGARGALEVKNTTGTHRQDKTHSLATWLRESVHGAQPSCLRHRAAGREFHRNGTDGRGGTKGHHATANACERSLASLRARRQRRCGSCALRKGCCVQTGKDGQERREGRGAARGREGTSRDLCPKQVLPVCSMPPAPGHLEKGHGGSKGLGWR